MSLSDFFSRTGIARLLSRVRIGGRTPSAELRLNRANTKRALKETFRRSVMSDHDVGRFATEIGATVKRRKRQTLSTLRGVMQSVRAQSRVVLSAGKSGRWHNQSVIDGRTSLICLRYLGVSWPQPYSAIPDKPGRHPNCRSFLVFVPDGEEPPDERPFMEQFEESEQNRRDLLKPARYAAYVNGDLPINSYLDYERAVLMTLVELGLDD